MAATSCIAVLALIMVIIISSSNASSPVITSGPQNTTVCINAKPTFSCGFSGANPHHVAPNWRIVSRSDNGSVISDVTHNGVNIARGRINGLQWLPDLSSGDNNNSPNSKLLVGPVSMAHNQSSYQCIIVSISGSIVSNVGTLKVVDTPSVIINVDEICITSVIISLNTYSHPACGDVSHNVTISGNVIYPDTINGSKYTIDNLQSDTLYNITVTSTYNSGSKTITQSVRTFPSQTPNSVNASSISVVATNIKNVNVIWEPPLIDICTMGTVKSYNVQINSTQDNHPITAVTVSVTVVNSEGLQSDPTMKTMFLQNNEAVTVSELPEEISVDVTNPEINRNNEKHSEEDSKLLMISVLAGVFFVTSVITTTITIILVCKLCIQKKNNDFVAVPAPAAVTQLQRELNLDNIEMQLSPAYVSLDSKNPRLYENIDSNNDNQSY